jgi:hypothetical protein
MRDAVGRYVQAKTLWGIKPVKPSGFCKVLTYEPVYVSIRMLPISFVLIPLVAVPLTRPEWMRVLWILTFVCLSLSCLVVIKRSTLCVCPFVSVFMSL